MRIGLDFDGVFTDLSDLKARGARKLFGVDIPEEIMHKHIILRKGLLTDKQYDELQKFIAKSDFGHTMRPVIGMQPHVKKLLREGYDLKIITSRDGKAIEIAREWLAKKNLDIEVIGIGPGKSKASFARELKLDVFVDDDLFKIEPLCGIVPHRILFSWPYNSHIQESSYVKRVSTWADLYRELNILGMWYVSGFPTTSGGQMPGLVEAAPL
jgi:uncharacterized HAD superfamily protein